MTTFMTKHGAKRKRNSHPPLRFQKFHKEKYHFAFFSAHVFNMSFPRKKERNKTKSTNHALQADERTPYANKP